MNQPLLLHVVERLEGLIGKLPATIQKPILHEVTPLKELFLQQRPPRLAFIGPGQHSPAIFFGATFAAGQGHAWQEIAFPDGGRLSVLDGHGADARQLEEELKRQPADIIVFLDDSESSRAVRKADLDLLERLIGWSKHGAAPTKVIAIVSAETHERLENALQENDIINERLIAVIPPDAKRFASIVVREVPNEARIEMIRLSRDKEAQHHVAQTLVKSTAAICTAVGAQPIPLADMPILTTLQLVMVSGIMYVSGRERTLRAATEFVGALGANVGAGIVFREGARAILKFLPGWGNVVSGMVAGAGTYAIGRAAEAFFIEGVSIKDARRTYRLSRKRAAPAELPAPLETKPKRRTRKSRATKKGANNL